MFGGSQAEWDAYEVVILWPPGKPLPNRAEFDPFAKYVDRVDG